MSVNLFWRPVRKINDNCMSKDLKSKIARHYFDQDGSLTSPPIVLNANDCGYLKGLVDGGTTEAQELINAIERFTQIEIFIQ